MEDYIFADELLTCWLNSSKMRRWLIHKKQSISQSIQLEDDREAKEAKAIEETVRMVVEKAEFLILLQ